MRKILNTLAFVSLAMAATSAFAANDLRKTVASMNKKVEACFLKRDMKGFEKATRPGITSDFKYTEGGRTMTYDQMVSQMKISFGMFKKVSVAKAKIVKVSEKGNAGTVMTTYHMEATMVGPDKKTHKLVSDDSSTDTYRKVGKDWKLAEMNFANGKMTMDGKPFDPNAAGGSK